MADRRRTTTRQGVARSVIYEPRVRFSEESIVYLALTRIQLVYFVVIDLRGEHGWSIRTCIDQGVVTVT